MDFPPYGQQNGLLMEFEEAPLYKEIIIHSFRRSKIRDITVLTEILEIYINVKHVSAKKHRLP